MSKQHPHTNTAKRKTTSSERSSVSAEGHRKRHHPQGNKRKHESLTKQSKKSTFVEKPNKNARAQAKTSSYKQNKQNI